MIHLVGPGGSGKSTAGLALAKKLGWQFLDLDIEFMNRFGDINTFIGERGYWTYASQNIDLALEIGSAADPNTVFVLSSGFMVYPTDINPCYSGLRRRIESSPSTYVLLAALDEELCVVETVRRQRTRPFAGSAAQEETKIRERFSVYAGLQAKKVTTMCGVGDVVAQICALQSAQQAAAADPTRVHAFCFRKSHAHAPVR